MKGFIQEYGNIIVVVAVILLMLLFGKTGFAKNIQEAILGSANHIVEKGESITDKDTGDILEIEGKKYIVMSKKDKDTYLVISGENIGNMQYQENQNSSNIYEDSYIDKYLESKYYSNLPEDLKNAIVTTQIKQVSYTNTGSNSKWKHLTKDTNPVSPDGTSNWFYNEGTLKNPKYVRYDKVVVPNGESGPYPLTYWKKKEKGYDGQAYNTITRHVYLPSVEEISNLVDLNDANKTYAFLKGTNNSLNHMWLRDTSSAFPRDAMYLDCSVRSLGNDGVTNPWLGVRPAFTVDLTKADYSEVGHVDYK